LDAKAVESYVRSWFKNLVRQIERQRFLAAIQRDFRIGAEHRGALEEAISRGHEAYIEKLPHLAAPDPAPVWAALRKPLRNTVELLTDLIDSGTIGDIVAASSTDAFGPGMPKPEQLVMGTVDADGELVWDPAPIVNAWFDRQRDVDRALEEMVTRLSAIGNIANEITKPKPRPAKYRTQDKALRAAADILVLEFWRGVLGRPYSSNHPAWGEDKLLGPKPGPRADRFFWVCLRAAGVTAEQLMVWSTVSKDYTDNLAGRSGRPPKKVKA
jgi:hypothetical protein